MPDHPLSHDDVDRILRIVDSAPEFAEFHMKFGEVEIRLGRAGGAAPPASAPPPALAAPAALAAPSAPAASAPAPSAASSAASSADARAATSGPAGPAASRTEAASLSPGATAVKAPRVGTFYQAPEPGAEPFVAVGQRVTRETIVCIVQVMELVHPVPAGSEGVVCAVLPADGQTVEYGQPLVLIETAAA